VDERRKASLRAKALFHPGPLNVRAEARTLYKASFSANSEAVPFYDMEFLRSLIKSQSR